MDIRARAIYFLQIRTAVLSIACEIHIICLPANWRKRGGSYANKFDIRAISVV